jgi:hypothetical protein
MRTPNPSDCADNILAANPDFNDDFLAGPTGGTDAVLSQSYGTTSGPGTPLETRSKESNGVGAKRRAAEIEDAGDDSAVMEERKRKIAKTANRRNWPDPLILSSHRNRLLHRLFSEVVTLRNPRLLRGRKAPRRALRLFPNPLRHPTLLLVRANPRRARAT